MADDRWAGEEAQRSSASSEALHFYREALRLYLAKHGAAADQEKVAHLEKNIAFALFSKGEYLESNDYYYRALQHFKIDFPRYRARDIHRILWNWVSMLKSIYFPKYLWSGEPTDRDGDLCKTIQYMGMALAVPNPRAFLIAYLPMSIKWLSKFNLRKIENGVGLYFAFNCALSWASLFTLAEKILQMKAKIELIGPVEKMYYETTKYHFNFLKGKAWEKGAQDFGYDEDLIDQNIALGQIWWTTMMMQYYAMKKIEQGDFQDCKILIQKIERIGIQYDHPHVMVLKHETEARMNLKLRLFRKAIDEADLGISSAKKTDVTLMLVSLISIKASALTLMGRVNEALETIKTAQRIYSQTDIIPYHLGDLFAAQTLIDMTLLGQAIKEGNNGGQSGLDRQAAKSTHKCLKNSKKAACYLIEALRMKGQYYRLTGDDRKAFTRWSKSIAEGERLGARPELARTYFEVGKRLLEPQSKYKELNGISAKEYFDKAEKLFREMDLQWDLEQLERVRLEL